jgi:hypothetical protein
MAIAASFDEAHDIGEEFVISGRDAPELFQLEEALDEIAFFVEINVVRALDFAVAFWRDDDFASTFDNLIVQVIGVVAFVGDHSAVNPSMSLKSWVRTFSCMANQKA